MSKWTIDSQFNRRKTNIDYLRITHNKDVTVLIKSFCKITVLKLSAQ